jgi:capsular exopolysaccharide synthesis family protein
MDLRKLLRPFLKWWWLIALAAVLAATSSYEFAKRRPAQYEAHTVLMVGSVFTNPNPDSGELYLSQQLASMYADIAQREPVRAAVATSLGLDLLPEYVASPLPNSQMLEIRVTAADPERAQTVADELAAQLIQHSPSSVQQNGTDRQGFVDQQLDFLEQRIQETEGEIDDLKLQMADLTSAREISSMEENITALQTKLSTLQTNYAAMVAASERGAMNTLSVVEPANLPTSPVNPQLVIIVGMAVVVGVVLAGTVAYAIEYFDDAVIYPEDVRDVLDETIIGAIPRSNRRRAATRDGPSGSPLALRDARVVEAVNMLRANVLLASFGRQPISILVTGTGDGVGKTTVAAQLASSYARGGLDVLLVDADLRNPDLHRQLGISNNVGLADVVQGTVDLQESVQPTGQDGLKVLPAGSTDANPYDLFVSNRFRSFLKKASEDFDQVVLDTPAIYFAETLIIASRVSGLLLVVRHGQSLESELAAARPMLERGEVSCIGVVVNAISRIAQRDFGIGDVRGSTSGRRPEPRAWEDRASDSPGGGGAKWSDRAVNQDENDAGQSAIGAPAVQLDHDGGGAEPNGKVPDSSVNGAAPDDLGPDGAAKWLVDTGPLKAAVNALRSAGAQTLTVLRDRLRADD